MTTPKHIRWIGHPQDEQLKAMQQEIPKGKVGRLFYRHTPGVGEWTRHVSNIPSKRPIAWLEGVEYEVIFFADVTRGTEVLEVEQVLQERGSRYGEYRDNSGLAIALQQVISTGTNHSALLPHHRYALDMFAAKIARIVNGDPNYEDNWTDIAGYAELVLKEIRNG